MDPNAVVLEISSDEDIGWNDHDGSGIADGGDDHNWLSELLDEVNKEKYGDDSDEVVVVSEVSVSPFEKTVKKSKLKSCVIDLDDDCVVLDDDPDKPVEVRNDNRININDDSDEILVVSEKGQVACRDYPHSRHLCIKFSFSTTPSQSHCEQCYCYVCDSLAPCVYWGNGSASTDHCRATDKDEFWKRERKIAKNGRKGIHPVPKVDFYRPSPALVQPHDQILRPRPVLAHHSSANFQTPNIINQNRTPMFASRNKFRPDLVSQLLLRTNGASRAHPNHNNNLGPQLHRQVFKRNGSVGVVTPANQPSYGSYRGNLGTPNGNQTYNVNEMISGPNKFIGSLQSNAVNSSVSYPQSQNHASTINPNPNFQPLPSQPQFSNHPNPTFQNQLNSNPLYQRTHLVPSSSGTRVGPGQPTYMVPVQSNYQVPSQTQVPQNFQENQAQNPTIDPSFQDYGLNWSPTEHSATFEGGAAATNEPPPLAAVTGGSLADYRYDWIFDNQPVEPGFLDIPGPYGLNDLSDSGFIDTGPIFDF